MGIDGLVGFVRTIVNELRSAVRRLLRRPGPDSPDRPAI